MKIKYARGMQSTNARSELLLHINNCGCFSQISEAIDVKRSGGRRDHHIVFVSSGAVESNYGRLGAGDMLYYRPGEAQSYKYLPHEHSTYIWIHFSGRLSDELIGRGSGIIKCHSKATEIREISLGCVKAISHGGEEYEKYALGLLVALAGLIEAGERCAEPFSRAISMMNDFSADYSVVSLAGACGMGAAHFTRLFKKYYGKSPTEYKAQIRIDQAKSMLVETDMRIKAIAESVGYNDALYFSRAFKKECGYSPSEYRALEREGLAT